MSTAAIAGIGLAVSAVGSYVSYRSQKRMIEEQTRSSTAAENAREQQMRLDAQRRRRQAVRESLAARSMALSIGTAQGAGGSSSLATATGGAIAQGQENQMTINASEEIGGRIFQANRDYFSATQRGQSAMALGQGISSLGGALVNNAETINRVGTYFGNRPGGSPQGRYGSGQYA